MSDYIRERYDRLHDRFLDACQARGAIGAWVELADAGRVTPADALAGIRDALAQWAAADPALPALSQPSPTGVSAVEQPDAVDLTSWCQATADQHAELEQHQLHLYTGADRDVALVAWTVRVLGNPDHPDSRRVVEILADRHGLPGGAR